MKARDTFNHIVSTGVRAIKSRPAFTDNAHLVKKYKRDIESLSINISSSKLFPYKSKELPTLSKIYSTVVNSHDFSKNTMISDRKKLSAKSTIHVEGKVLYQNYLYQFKCINDLHTDEDKMIKKYTSEINNLQNELNTYTNITDIMDSNRQTRRIAFLKKEFDTEKEMFEDKRYVLSAVIADTNKLIDAYIKYREDSLVIHKQAGDTTEFSRVKKRTGKKNKSVPGKVLDAYMTEDLNVATTDRQKNRTTHNTTTFTLDQEVYLRTNLNDKPKRIQNVENIINKFKNLVEPHEVNKVGLASMLSTQDMSYTTIHDIVSIYNKDELLSYKQAKKLTHDVITNNAEEIARLLENDLSSLKFTLEDPDSLSEEDMTQVLEDLEVLDLKASLFYHYL